jgi:undecaprenyl-diphosphatase
VGDLGSLVGSPAGEALKSLSSQRDLMRVAAYSAGVALLLTLYVAWHGTPIPGDVAVIRKFQAVGFFDDNERWVNALGLFSWQVGLVALGLLIAAFGPAAGLTAGSRQQRTAAIWSLLIALGLRVLSTPLKEMAQAKRPSLDFHVRVNAEFPGYGFPSGHVYSDVLIFGTLAVVAPRLVGPAAGAAVRVLCLAVIVLAGPSRMSIGAHWPSDVLGGYLWGTAALCLAVAGGWRMAGKR